MAKQVDTPKSSERPSEGRLDPLNGALVTLKPYQQRAVETLTSGKVLFGGTGAGKSLTALAYYLTNEAPKNFVVITTAQKRDKLEWDADGMKMGISTHDATERAGQMKVDSWNNIKKYEGLKDRFFIFDEQRLVGSGAWVKSFLKIAKHNRWIMLTATPGDKWEDYSAIFLANGFYKNVTEFRREHMVYSYYGGYPKLIRYLNEKKLDRLRDHVLVEMEYEAHTVRHIHQIPVSYDKATYKSVMKVRRNPETGEPFQGITDLLYYLRKIVNSDKSRRSEILKVATNAKRLIIFYNFDYELEILRDTFKDWKRGEWNGHRHEALPKGDRWVYLVQYTAGSEGWNCITTDSLAFFSLTYSYKAYAQAQGRIDRMNTPYKDLHYFVLRSSSASDVMIFDALRNKKDFNERAFLNKVHHT